MDLHRSIIKNITKSCQLSNIFAWCSNNTYSAIKVLSFPAIFLRYWTFSIFCDGLLWADFLLYFLHLFTNVAQSRNSFEGKSIPHNRYDCIFREKPKTRSDFFVNLSEMLFVFKCFVNFWAVWIYPYDTKERKKNTFRNF